MSSLNFNFRDKPTDLELGVIGRVVKRAGALAAVGGVAGWLVAGALTLAGGPLVWGGIVIGALAGAVWGMKSSDPKKVQNRPVDIEHPLWGRQKVYISAEQWQDIKAKMAEGVDYDEFRLPELRRQFDAPEPPAGVKPSNG